MKIPKLPGARRERALATRRRIVKAAYALFRARGYAGSTMEAIAGEAGVAVQTLYFTFQTKAAILDEVVGAAILGFDQWVPQVGRVRAGDPTQLRAVHQWFAAFEAEKTAQGALTRFVDASVEIMERVAPLVSVMRQAESEPEAKAVSELGESRRVESYQAVIRLLAKKEGGLRSGLTVRRATDVLLAVCSGEVYQMLRDRGWKPRELRAWLLELLSEQLLA
jgi:AcrR family transcriptional regulator